MLKFLKRRPTELLFLLQLIIGYDFRLKIHNCLPVVNYAMLYTILPPSNAKKTPLFILISYRNSM
jgi:hypothetical protein